MKRDFSVHIAAITLFVTLAIPIQAAAQQYTVKDLGPADDWTGGVNNKSLVDGTALQPDGTDHAFVWRKGKAIDLGTFGGPNSVAFKKPSESGLVVGKAETPNSDPLGEDFCMFGTQLICVPFVWQDGTKTPLPTLGGNNGIAFGVNNRSQLAGMAENTTQNPTCPSANLEAKAVIWEKGKVEELPTYRGDNDSAVISLNDYGQAVGLSGDCISSPNFLRNVLWKNGAAVDLGNLGGTLVNEANNINNLGQVVGLSDLPGDASFHAFLWTEDTGISDLGTLPGDTFSSAHANNDKGWIVGASCTADFDCRAVLWRDGQITDLNTLIPADSPFSLVEAFDINSRGEILSLGVTDAEETHDYLAVPSEDPKGDSVASYSNQNRGRVLPERVRQLLRRNATPLSRGLARTSAFSDAKVDINNDPSSHQDDLIAKHERESLFALHHGYCSVANDKLTGSCIASYVWFCMSGKSSACPYGATALKPKKGTCGVLGSPTVDVARPCSF